MLRGFKESKHSSWLMTALEFGVPKIRMTTLPGPLGPILRIWKNFTTCNFQILTVSLA
jgi:hypothetical protein